MSKYPDWVRQYREPGTTIKKVGASYYLYKSTSIRVPGMKNPQPKAEYIGAITKGGVVRSNVKKLSISAVRVYEYGFSHAMEQLLPAKFMDDIGDKEKGWQLFLNIVKKYSDSSYLLRGVELAAPEDLHVCICTQAKKFERLAGIKIEEMLPLKRIYLVEMDGQEMVSEIPASVAELMAQKGITI